MSNTNIEFENGSLVYKSEKFNDIQGACNDLRQAAKEWCEEIEEMQDSIYRSFNEAIEQKRNCLFKPYSKIETRQVGKTHVLNAIGLEYQSLGYEVILVTNEVSTEHLTTKYIDIENANQWFGIFNRDSKAIIIVDGYDSKSSRFLDFLEYCKSYKIPVIGFVD